jgi:hypothetical protein
MNEGDLAMIHSPVAKFAFAMRMINEYGDSVKVKIDHGVPVVYLKSADKWLCVAWQQPLVMIFAIEMTLLIDERFLRVPDV